MTTYETLNVQSFDRVAHIELNRPQARNAFNQQMRRELLQAIEAIETDDEIRVVAISGAGKGFSAGADLMEGLAGHDDVISQLTVEYKPFLMAIDQSSKLYVAVVHGIAAGMGGSLALCCDFTVMAQSSCLYQAFSQIALVPDGGMSQLLIRTVGYKRALQMIVEGQRISAEDCLQLGLANKLVSDEQTLAEALEWADQLASGAPLSQSRSKALLKQALQLDYSATFDAEARAQDPCTRSQDFAEGVQAVFQKRPAAFQGC